MSTAEIALTGTPMAELPLLTGWPRRCAPAGARFAPFDTGRQHGPTPLRVAVCHPHDCRLYVSTDTWQDAPYALAYGPYRHRFTYAPDYARAVLLRIFGTLPEWPGEYVERGREP